MPRPEAPWRGTLRTPGRVSRKSSSVAPPSVEHCEIRDWPQNFGVMSTETVELDWRRHLVEDDARAIEIARTMKRIAVLGIKTEERRAKPAYYVPEYLA